MDKSNSYRIEVRAAQALAGLIHGHVSSGVF